MKAAFTQLDAAAAWPTTKRRRSSRARRRRAAADRARALDRRSGRGQSVLPRGDHPHRWSRKAICCAATARCALTRPVDGDPHAGDRRRADRRAPRSPRPGGEARRAGRRRARPPVLAASSSRRSLGGEGIDVERELDGPRGARHPPPQDGDARRRAPLRREPDPGSRLRGPAAASERRQLHDRVGRAGVGAAPAKLTAERSALLAHHLARSEDRARGVEALLAAAAQRGAAAFLPIRGRLLPRRLGDRRTGHRGAPRRD